MAAWRHALAIVLLPGSATVVVPAVVLLTGDGPDIGWGLGGAAGAALAVIGVVLVGCGAALAAWTIRLFARAGRGTLAPWDPPRRLVVEGPYRHVRNPMISAVATVLLGEALFLGSPWLLGWWALFFVVNCVWFVVYEEPGLERRFGGEYRDYKRGVPRWIPRRTPWQEPR